MAGMPTRGGIGGGGINPFSWTETGGACAGGAVILCSYALNALCRRISIGESPGGGCGAGGGGGEGSGRFTKGDGEDEDEDKEVDDCVASLGRGGECLTSSWSDNCMEVNHLPNPRDKITSFVSSSKTPSSIGTIGFAGGSGSCGRMRGGEMGGGFTSEFTCLMKS
jgi:hypothetical protein